jgi:hypothetical protein
MTTEPTKRPAIIATSQVRRGQAVVKLALQTTTPAREAQQELEEVAARHEVDFYQVGASTSREGSFSTVVGIIVEPAKYDAVLADLEGRGYQVQDRRRLTSA